MRARTSPPGLVSHGASSDDRCTGRRLATTTRSWVVLEVRSMGSLNGWPWSGPRTGAGTTCRYPPGGGDQPPMVCCTPPARCGPSSGPARAGRPGRPDPDDPPGERPAGRPAACPPGASAALRRATAERPRGRELAVQLQHRDRGCWQDLDVEHASSRRGIGRRTGSGTTPRFPAQVVAMPPLCCGSVTFPTST